MALATVSACLSACFSTAGLSGGALFDAAASLPSVDAAPNGPDAVELSPASDARDAPASDGRRDANEGLDARHDAALDLAPATDIRRDTGGEVAPATDAEASATVVVSPSQVLATVGQDFVGLSYEKSHLATGLFNGGNANLVGLFGRVGASLLRIGGNSVDHTSWTPGGAGQTSGTVSRPDVDALAAFLRAASWQALYGLNYATSTPAQAADEAAYVATSLGDRLYGFEIGNEPDEYSSNSDEATTFGYADFLTGWESYAAAITTAVPGAVLTGPAAAGNYATWTVPFASAEAARIALLTQHWYRANGEAATSTIDLLLSPIPSLLTEIDALVMATSAAKIAGGIRFAETNSFYNGGAPGISDAFGSALWVLDYAFTQAEHGSAGINLHSGGEGTGYTPIADSGSSVVEARPEYYGVAMFALATPGQVVQTQVDLPDQPSSPLRAHAVLADDGTTRIVLIDVDRTLALDVTVELARLATSAQAISLRGPSLDATSGVTLGGTSIAVDGSATPLATSLPVSGSTVVVDLSPASAVLLEVR
ncbi:MAG: heparinase [Polyangia bacterium]|jgi:hypothetical protein